MTQRALITAAAAACLLLLLLPGRASAQDALGAPQSLGLTEGQTSFTATWTAPASDGGSAITAYDLRYILSDAGDLADEHWTVLEEIWSSGAGGVLLYQLTGLQRDASYDVQVRAVNVGGDGPWSETVSAATSDHGDTRDTALALGSSLTGRIEDVDTDWFSITVTGTEDIWIHSASDSPVDLAGEFVDSTGNVVTSSDNGYRVDNTLDFSLRARLDAGTYFVRVEGGTAPGAAHTGPYVLHASRGITPGDSSSSATAIAIGDSVAAFIGSGNQYFTFTVARTTALWIVSEGSTDTRAELIDSDLDAVASDDDSYLPGNELGFLIGVTLDPGVYYLRVSPFQATAEGPYILRPFAGARACSQ